MRLPRLNAFRAFVRACRAPTRASTLRGAADGALVCWRLHRGRPVRSLLPAPPPRPAALDDEAPLDDALASFATASAVDAGLAVLPFEATCLRRSLTLLRELARREVPAQLNIGVRMFDQRFEAHAWVTVGDLVVNDSPAVAARYGVISAGEFERVAGTLR